MRLTRKQAEELGAQAKERRRKREASASPGRVGGNRRMKILVVEDEPGVRAYTTATLTNSGDEVESASDGDEAFRLYRRRGPYDLVLTDRHHPGMDGLDLAAAIRQENPTQANATTWAARTRNT